MCAVFIHVEGDGIEVAFVKFFDGEGGGDLLVGASCQEQAAF